MKDILVQLDGGPRSAARLEAAIAVARTLGASRLTGLFAHSESHGPSAVARRASDHLHAAAERAETAFHAALAGSGILGRWWKLSHGEHGHVIAETVFCARYADLVILGQYDADSSRVPEELIEQVVLNSGRPVLVLPHSGGFESIGARVSVAWNASREASRALHDAMPFLEMAAEVTILAIRNTGPGAVPHPDDVPAVDIADSLATHGIAAKTERLTGEDIGVMDLLLSRSFDVGADLLVMGAHSGLGFSFTRGAGTRFILGHMTLPVLMSN
ncbi:MAG TPA: universal stress protein [Patescibacteria group bacterium]|nr:universal stress protein [Patescibacteria group bacterium]